jgi:hypothetical protein
VAYLTIFDCKDFASYQGIVVWKMGFVACLTSGDLLMRRVITRKSLTTDHRTWKNDCCSRVGLSLELLWRLSQSQRVRS